MIFNVNNNCRWTPTNTYCYAIPVGGKKWEWKGNENTLSVLSPCCYHGDVCEKEIMFRVALLEGNTYGKTWLFFPHFTPSCKFNPNLSRIEKKKNNINWKKDFDYAPHDGVSKSYQSKKWIKAVDLKSVTGVSVMFSSIYAELSA